MYLFNYPENNAYLMSFLDKNLTFRRWMTWHYPINTGMSPTNFTRSQHSILFYIKGKKAKVFFNWEHMPIVGVNYRRKIEVGEIEIPDSYNMYKKRA